LACSAASVAPFGLESANIFEGVSLVCGSAIALAAWRSRSQQECQHVPNRCCWQRRTTGRLQRTVAVERLAVAKYSCSPSLPAVIREARVSWALAPSVERVRGRRPTRAGDGPACGCRSRGSSCGQGSKLRPKACRRRSRSGSLATTTRDPYRRLCAGSTARPRGRLRGALPCPLHPRACVRTVQGYVAGRARASCRQLSPSHGRPGGVIVSPCRTAIAPGLVDGVTRPNSVSPRPIGLPAARVRACFHHGRTEGRRQAFRGGELGVGAADRITAVRPFRGGSEGSGPPASPRLDFVATGDPVVTQALIKVRKQLSKQPISSVISTWWAHKDSNLGPAD
jgi:hypothetical protein